MSSENLTPQSRFTRAQFLQRGACTLSALALLRATSVRGETPAPTERSSSPSPQRTASTQPYDLREFVNWIETELEPAVRLPGPAGNYAREFGGQIAELYGVSDMACILSTIGKLNPSEKERAEWASVFETFQDPATGFLIEKQPSHSPLHNTAFALAAMQLLELRPKLPITLGPEYHDIRTFLGTLDWKTKVYPESHKGAGIGSIFTLVPSLHSEKWFADYFSTCDSLFDPKNGLMGKEKPAAGDFDQIGGTFHYAFLYHAFNRQMPFPQQRIDAILGLQQPDGYWEAKNHLWLTLDAIYLLTRTLRQLSHRREEIVTAVRKSMDALMRDVFSPAGRKQAFTGRLAVHSVTAAISTAAEVQNFLGADQVETPWPLRLVLDRRPFI